jgi:ferric iron reductase protein FhuF
MQYFLLLYCWMVCQIFNSINTKIQNTKIYITKYKTYFKNHVKALQFYLYRKCKHQKLESLRHFLIHISINPHSKTYQHKIIFFTGLNLRKTLCFQYRVNNSSVCLFIHVKVTIQPGIFISTNNLNLLPRNVA